MKTFAVTFIFLALNIGLCAAALAHEEAMSVSRAQVIAERDAAIASGWIAAIGGEDSGSFFLSRQPWVSTVTRAQVAAEVRIARASAELSAMNAEGGQVGPAPRWPAAESALRYVGPNLGREPVSKAQVAQASR